MMIAFLPGLTVATGFRARPLILNVYGFVPLFTMIIRPYVPRGSCMSFAQEAGPFAKRAPASVRMRRRLTVASGAVVWRAATAAVADVAATSPATAIVTRVLRMDTMSPLGQSGWTKDTNRVLHGRAPKGPLEGGPAPRRRLLGAAVVTSAAAAIAAVLALPGAPFAAAPAGAWPQHNGDVAGTRTAGATRISSATAGRLRVAWRIPFARTGGYAGIFASNPVVAGGVVYWLDLESRLTAASLRTGKVLWSRASLAPNTGPNGIAYGDGVIAAATDTTAYAVDARSGRQLWAHRLATSRAEQFVEIAPVVADGRVYLSTVGFPPGGRGALYALDLRSGRTVWRFDTIEGEWGTPQAGGGGAWYPVSVDGQGRVYAGTANPGPWGGSRAQPNGGAFPGAARWTDSLLVLDGRTGKLLWADQVTPHDVRDHDFQDTPILLRAGGRALVVGAGKAGRVIAWDRATGRRVWEAAVGRHRNDTGPLPRTPVEVCPGLFGGVETPMAAAGGRVFVPVVNLCTRESAVSPAPLATMDITTARGELVALDAATGRRLWRRELPQAAFGCATVAGDVVLTSSFDGQVWGFRARDGRLVWHDRLRAAINGCPAVAGDTVVFGAGAALPGQQGVVRELVAYRLP